MPIWLHATTTGHGRDHPVHWLCDVDSMVEGHTTLRL